MPLLSFLEPILFHVPDAKGAIPPNVIADGQDGVVAFRKLPVGREGLGFFVCQAFRMTVRAALEETVTRSVVSLRICVHLRKSAGV